MNVLLTLLGCSFNKRTHKHASVTIETVTQKLNVLNTGWKVGMKYWFKLENLLLLGGSYCIVLEFLLFCFCHICHCPRPRDLKLGQMVCSLHRYSEAKIHPNWPIGGTIEIFSNITPKLFVVDSIDIIWNPWQSKQIKWQHYIMASLDGFSANSSYIRNLLL